MSDAHHTRFFKIVTDPESNKLKLPTSFIRKCRQKLPAKITLKAPGGSLRQVDLVHCNGETWLHKGWEEFKDYYSVSFGHLLVFVYDGNSHFDVLIFDMTTVEIEYPIDIATDDEEEKCRDIKGKGKVTKETLQKKLDKETSIAYQKAKSFQSNNPFFISLVHPSHVSNKFNFKIPVAFARKNLSNKSFELRLRVQEDGIWNVRCVLSSLPSIGAGWAKFVKANNLRAGDVCVFEVITKKLWNVIIYRH